MIAHMKAVLDFKHVWNAYNDGEATLEAMKKAEALAFPEKHAVA